MINELAHLLFDSSQCGVAASSIAGRVSLICLLISSMDSLYQHGDRFYDPTSLLSWCVFHRQWRGLMPPVHSALPM